MTYKLTLENHPAQAVHPFNRQRLFDADGKPVPLFPKQRSVKLDGRVIALVNESGHISFIVPLSKLGVIADEAKLLVGNEFGAVGKVFAIAERTIPVEVDEDEDEAETETETELEQENE